MLQQSPLIQPQAFQGAIQLRRGLRQDRLGLEGSLMLHSGPSYRPKQCILSLQQGYQFVEVGKDARGGGEFHQGD